MAYKSHPGTLRLAQYVLAERAKGRTLADIANDLRVTRQRVHQIEQRAKRIGQTGRQKQQSSNLEPF